MDESIAQDDQVFAGKSVRGMFEGPILGLLARLAFPVFTGMFFQLLYSLVDTLYISRIDMADPSYVGGTGMVFPLIFIIIALSSGLLIGTSALVARSIGEKNREVLDKTAESGLVVGLALGTLLVVFGYIFDDGIIGLLGARGDYYTHALEYFRYMLPAGFLMIAGNVLNGILQGEGLMKRVMTAMIIGTATNIVLDPVFIFLLGMKVEGAGLATSLSQVVVAAYVLGLFIRKKTLVPIHWKVANVNFEIVKRIVSVGFPQTLGQLTMSVSFLIFNRIIVGIDSLAMTAFTICGRFDQFIIMPILSIGTALVTMIGQNYGRGNLRRVKDIWKTCVIAAVGTAALLAVVLFIFVPVIYPVFTRVDQVLRYAVRQTRIVIFSFTFVAVVIIVRAAFQSMGKPLPGFVIDVMRLLLIGVPMAFFYVNVLDLGVHGVWLGMITGNFVAAAVGILWVRGYFGRVLEGKGR